MLRLLICPGAQKAGTTWFFRVMKVHPEVWAPPLKELSYLVDWPEKREKGLARRDTMKPEHRDWFETFAAERKVENYVNLFPKDGVSLDVSPAYSRFREAAINAAKVVPNAVIVIFLRDPVERAWSHAKMVARDTGRANDVAFIEKFAVSQRARDVGDYRTFLNDWTAQYPNRTYVFNYTAITTNPHRLINRVCEIMGLSPVPEDFAPLRREANKGHALKVTNYDAIAEAHQGTMDLYKTFSKKAGWRGLEATELV